MANESWFEPNITYEGYGRAEFENPKGYAEGPFKIEFTENNQSRIEMIEAADFVNEAALNTDYDLEHLLTGVAPKKLFGSSWMFGWPTPVKNRCTKLEVEIEQPKGHFSASGIKHYPSIPPFSGKKVGVWFWADYSEFTISAAQKAKYWILPLLNFIPQFVQVETSRTPHPLRINPDQAWISFDFNNTLGFIDPLEDYEARKRGLISGGAQTLLTTVMIGVIGENGLASNEVQAWLPFDFFESVLSLATGTQITTPWIEFRDSNRALVKRIHMQTATPVFRQGHEAIGAYHEGGIGNLLLNSQQSRFFRDRELQVVIKRLVRAGTEGRTVEDQLSATFSGFETLAEILGIKASTTKDLLSKENYDEVKRILGCARNAIQKIEVASAESDAEKKRIEAEQERITRIANRMYIPLDVNLSFGEIVCAIIREIGFADIEVAVQKFGSEKELQQHLTHNRAAIMHGDYLKGMQKFTEGGRLLYHLHDLGIRTVLKLLNYDGGYYPVVAKIPQAKVSIDEKLDWVTPSRPASDLGYL